MEIVKYTYDRLDDVIAFEKQLRVEEDFWGWEIDDAYIQKVKDSFQSSEFQSSISLLAYCEAKVVGRIDCAMIHSHFDGSTKAYLDWICVVKSYRHKGVAQALMASLRKELHDLGIDTLVGLIASNEEAQRFYRNLERSQIRDEGIWIDC